MPADSPNLFERLRGKRFSDIVLPPEGPPDPTLPPSTATQLAKAAKGYKDSQKNEILKGLYEAADEKKR
jgi:hypothetical protein